MFSVAGFIFKYFKGTEREEYEEKHGSKEQRFSDLSRCVQIITPGMFLSAIGYRRSQFEDLKRS